MKERPLTPRRQRECRPGMQKKGVAVLMSLHFLFFCCKRAIRALSLVIFLFLGLTCSTIALYLLSSLFPIVPHNTCKKKTDDGEMGGAIILFLQAHLCAASHREQPERHVKAERAPTDLFSSLPLVIGE